MFRKICVLALLFFSFSLPVLAGNEEVYINEIKGATVAPGNSFIVRDNKIQTDWRYLDKILSIISFEIDYENNEAFVNIDYTANLNVTIEAWGKDTTQQLAGWPKTTDMVIRHTAAQGSVYKFADLYKISGAHKIRVTINSINSAELGSPIPLIFKVKGQMNVVNRKYDMSPISSGSSTRNLIGNQLFIDWSTLSFTGAESFDLEYTFFDIYSYQADALKTRFSTGGGLNGTFNVPLDTLSKWFRNNSTRIVTSATTYSLNLPYDSGFILYRIRGVQIKEPPDEIRITTDWNYQSNLISEFTSNTAAVFIQGHEPGLNWQYSASFAEEGKRKEVVGYFDGTMRNRQNVTINNSDNKSIVQESYLDPLGRPSVSSLPVPVNDSVIRYFKALNKNLSQSPYSYADVLLAGNCTVTAGRMDSSSGSSQYYSSSNPFMNDSRWPFTKYVAGAHGYPFAVTEYTADQTGRIKSQGGVGPDFQIGSGHETKYFYGKPSQKELDRLFGNEAGNYNHYLKNMVVDGNGQISVSYVNANGKTVATALAGASPASLSILPGGEQSTASVRISNDLLLPENFQKDAADYSLKASSTFLAPVTGNYSFNYAINPAQLKVYHGETLSTEICNNCYYDLVIKVTDNCNQDIDSVVQPSGNIFDTSCVVPQAVQGNFSVVLNKIGEYNVSYTLRVSKNAVDYYDSVHIVKNSSLKKLDQFLLDQLANTNFKDCFSTCESCREDLGTKEEFQTFYKGLYIQDSLLFSLDDSIWVNNLYDSIYAQCQALLTSGTCATVSTSPCESKLAILKADVNPGGQYAMVDSLPINFVNAEGESQSGFNFSFADSATNVLVHYNNIIFTNKEGIPDSVSVDRNGLEVLLPVNQLTPDELIKNWNESWADSLVSFHPEYCYYKWCTANANSYSFDDFVQNEIIDGKEARDSGFYSYTNYAEIINKDPFFKPGGNGYGLATKMMDSLRLYSRQMLKTSQTDKNILQVVDLILYCSDQSNGWSACLPPDSTCRAISREWNMYKNFYFDLKQKFYELARRTSTDPQFANCVNCFVGNAEIFPSAEICIPPDTAGFVFETLYTPTIAMSRKGNNAISKGGVMSVEVNKFQSLIKLEGAEYHLRYLNGLTTNNYLLTLILKRESLPNDTVFYLFPSNRNDVILNGFIDSLGIYPNAVRIIKAECFIGPYLPLTTCNPTCPDGLYSPYGMPGVSYYVTSGVSTGKPTTGIPVGYRNERFFSIFNLKKADSTECQFYNVWVFDNNPLNVDSAGILATTCVADERTILYKDKIRRFPEYQDKNAFINSALASNPNDLKVSASLMQVNECKTNCTQQADFWIDILSKCTTDPATLADIKNSLIEVCSQACALGQVNGASSYTDEGSYSRSFEDIIRDYLGPNAINDSCTQELLGMPYPFGKQPKYSQKLIDVTDYDLCKRIQQFEYDYNSSGFTGSFHQYLLQLLPNDYILTEAELNDLKRSCTSCNGLLNQTIALPTAFEADAPACLTCITATSLKTSFETKFPGITVENNPRYETLFTNYFNHNLGFSLSYLDYQDFFARCTESGYSGRLCNQSLNPIVLLDSNYNNSCMRNLFSTALSVASEEYTVYIDSVRAAFRDAYMSRCLNVAPGLSMTADLYEYHYTLYYYDQSGNLVKTIPPKGVVLLTDAQLLDVQRYRLLTKEGCYSFSDSVRLNGAGYIQFPLAGNSQLQPLTLEAYVNPTNLSDQVIFAKLLAGTGSQGAYSTGYVLQIKNQKLVLTFKALGPGQLPIQAVAESQNISGILNTGLWNYIAFGRTTNTNAPAMLYVNGRPLALTYTENTLAAYKPTSLDGQDLVVGRYPAGMPGFEPVDYFTGTIKNIRIYNRLLSNTEITQNAFSLCQQPVSNYGLIFWSLVNTAASNLVPSVVGGQGTVYNTSWQAFAGVYPQHTLPTTYQYNSLNQVVRQSTPDAGVSQFWYDYIGRLVISQNAEQANVPSYPSYSYTLYDNIGRITEVGEKVQANVTVTHALSLDRVALINWLNAYQSQQITHTVYDDYNAGGLLTDPLHEPIYTAMGFSTSRKRVVASFTKPDELSAISNASYYNYDINGNVKTLWQENAALNQVSEGADGIKRIDYDYDLVSGKVNKVSYQPGKGDQFFHKYLYDAENRLTDVYTSRDELIWQQDAFYRYYLHGPLARTEIGQRKVQGLDYAYTLQGWIKGVNGVSNDAATDIGRDNYQVLTEFNHSTVSKDVFSYELDYFNSDYRAIGTTDQQFKYPFNNFATETSAVSRQLFNGNIMGMSTSLSQFGLAHYRYRYDQLNRLTEKHSFKQEIYGLEQTFDFAESFIYDANGNILTANRNASNASPGGQVMDNLNYQYENNTNRLNFVTDNINASSHDYDVDGQSAQNYTYDLIGNLVADAQEHITSINWSVYGKIRGIIKRNTTTGKETTTQYGYDPSGNRTYKEVIRRDIGNYSQDIVDRTYYVRDAQGNTMATYSRHEESGNTPSLKWSEQHLYGSSRLGVMNLNLDIPAQPMIPQVNQTLVDSLHTGEVVYELSNHLGNVMATISDKKLFSNIVVPETGAAPLYYPEVLSQTDYYAFGQEIKERAYRISGGYRYGFNGKENDGEIKGEGNQQDYGMRIYDPRLGRFLSVDPITNEYPFLTPYQFASNRPIDGIDLDGLEYLKTIPQFEKTGGWFDYVTAIDNGLIGIINTVPNTWNSAVANVQALKKGTWKNDISKEAKQIRSGIESTAKQFYHEPIKTLTSPEAVQFYTEAYIGGKIFSTIPKTKNLQKNVISSEVVEQSTIELGNGMQNPKTKAAVDLGNKVHYDQLNGGSGVGLPTELSLLYPNTQFRFTLRGAKGADVEVVGGTHPYAYPNSTWIPENNFADFKPNSPSGNRRFKSEVKSGKLPENTQKLLYDSKTGKLQ